MLDETLKRARILIVDDLEANVHLLEAMLQMAGYTEVRSTTNPREVVTLRGEFQPDLIVLDLVMPELDGFEVMELIKPMIPHDTYLPILVLTADATLPSRQRALAIGAQDFLTKPFDPTEVLLRIRNLLEARFLLLEFRNQNAQLKLEVHERTLELNEAQVQALERLALAAEYRDDSTMPHARRVGEWSARIARALGMPAADVQHMKMAAMLHDVGKLGIPDHILLKTDRFTPEEITIKESHTTMGATILSGIGSPLLQMAREIALTHHERWDGTGYPQGLKGDAIPLSGRIVAVADAYDAMTHHRLYQEAVPAAEAVEVLWAGAGTQWDREVVERFVKLKMAERSRRS